MISTPLFSSLRWLRIRICSWARPPGPRMPMLIRSLAPLTLPREGWGNAPVATAAPVATPADSRNVRRLTMGFSFIDDTPEPRKVGRRPVRADGQGRMARQDGKTPEGRDAGGLNRGPVPDAGGLNRGPVPKVVQSQDCQARARSSGRH